MDVLGSQREVLQVPIPDGGTGTLLDFFRVMAASGRIMVDNAGLDLTTPDKTELLRSLSQSL